ncbi:hypothetical protein [Mycolicibacterium sp. XJ1819]
MSLRSSLYLSTLLTAAIAGAIVGGTASASATPVEETAQPIECVGALSGPELVVLPGGGNAVRARVTTTSCVTPAQPTDVVVCLTTATGYNMCDSKPGWNTVQVIVPPTPADGVFTATGKVCSQHILGSFTSRCTNLGPVQATF